MSEVQTATTRRPTRDTRETEVRKEVRAVLARSRVEIKRTTSGKDESSPAASYMIQGQGVETPFLRYYLKQKLDRINKRFGVNVDLRRKNRGEDHIFVDLYMSPKVADDATDASPEAAAA